MAKEESPLERIFGNNPRARIIDTPVSHPDCDYSPIELAESAEVQLSWIAFLKDMLLHYNIMKPTLIVNNRQLYKIDKKSPVGKLLNLLSFKLADTDIEKEL